MQIATASQWAIHSSVRLYRKMKQLQPDVSDQEAYESYYVTGANVFSDVRWQLWKQHLAFVAAEAEGVREEEIGYVAKMALQACKAMSAAERSYVFVDSGSSEESQGSQGSRDGEADVPSKGEIDAHE